MEMHSQRKNVSLLEILCLSTILSSNVIITRAHEFSAKVSQDSIIAAEQACQSYHNIFEIYYGVPEIDVRISGGLPAYNENYPFMTAIGHRLLKSNRYFEFLWVCGGSLITNGHVLTAAHCVTSKEPDDIMVRLGTRISGIKNLDEEVYTTQVMRISRIHIHPSYKRSQRTWYFDLAILRLAGLATYSNRVLPVCLQSRPISTISNEEFVATGWGATEFEGDASMHLLKTRNLKLVDQQTCNQFYEDSYNVLPNGVNASLLCALDSNPVKNSDTCPGDSGGPLFLESDSVSTLVGVVTGGIACGFAEPGIYASVYVNLDWIKDIVWYFKTGSRFTFID